MRHTAVPVDCLRSVKGWSMRRSGFAHMMVVVAIVALGSTVAGCTDTGDAPVASSTVPDGDPAPSASDAPPPTLTPGGTAAENLDYFEYVATQTVATLGNPGGRDFIDALIAAGFDRAGMQVTEDLDTLGDPRTLIEFSVRMSDACLVGQWGQGALTVHEMPALSNGQCLIGQTRPIDW